MASIWRDIEEVIIQESQLFSQKIVWPSVSQSENKFLEQKELDLLPFCKTYFLLGSKQILKMQKVGKTIHQQNWFHDKNLYCRKILKFSTLCLRNKKTFLPYKQPWFLLLGWLSQKKFFHYNNLYCIRSIINASLSLVSLLVMPLDDSGQFRGQSTKEVIQKVLLIQASSAKPV